MSKCRSSACSRRRCLKGGAASDYVGLFHAPYGANDTLSQYTLSHLSNTPMFNPMSHSSVFATPSSGIIPTGSYLQAIAPISSTIDAPVTQMGGIKRRVTKRKTIGTKTTKPKSRRVVKRRVTKRKTTGTKTTKPKPRRVVKRRVTKKRTTTTTRKRKTIKCK